MFVDSPLAGQHISSVLQGFAVVVVICGGIQLQSPIVASDSNYFPPAESQGGWRQLTTPDEIRNLAAPIRKNWHHSRSGCSQATTATLPQWSSTMATSCSKSSAATVPRRAPAAWHPCRKRSVPPCWPSPRNKASAATRRRKCRSTTRHLPSFPRLCRLAITEKSRSPSSSS